jgi:hypothetical protein
MTAHVHISTATELTICTAHDAPTHIAGIIAEAKLPEVAGTTVTRTFGEDATIIVVDHPETEVTTIRIKECRLNCWGDAYLKDYWL